MQKFVYREKTYTVEGFLKAVGLGIKTEIDFSKISDVNLGIESNVLVVYIVDGKYDILAGTPVIIEKTGKPHPKQKVVLMNKHVLSKAVFIPFTPPPPQERTDWNQPRYDQRDRPRGYADRPQYGQRRNFDQR